jgi:hypothetical protein
VFVFVRVLAVGVVGGFNRELPACLRTGRD